MHRIQDAEQPSTGCAASERMTKHSGLQSRALVGTIQNCVQKLLCMMCS